MSLSCTGCWEEVHFEPSKDATPATQKAVELNDKRPVDQPTPEPKALLDEVEPMPIPDASSREETVLEETTSWLPSRTAPATWQMSSQWSMAVALQAKGRDEESFAERIKQAETGAQLLEVSLPVLTTHGEGADRLSANLVFLLEDAGPRLVGELNQSYDANHAALAELAIKTHVLLLNYTPASPRLAPVIAAIRQAAESSGLPESVWLELVELLEGRAEFPDVKAAIFQLHQRATEHLGG